MTERPSPAYAERPASPSPAELTEPLLGGLIDVSHGLPPWRVARAVSEHAAIIGGTDVAIYLQDYSQAVLVPLAYEGDIHRSTEQMEGSLPGRAFSSASSVEWPVDDGVRLFLLLLNGADRVGVLALTLPAVDDGLRKLATRMASVVTDMIVTKGALTDEYLRARRRRPMALAAEMQWHLLPPLTVQDPRIELAGVLEPAYEVGGDAFDYAINLATAHVAMFDAMGHGLRASTMATVAVGAYRHARRQRIALADMYVHIDEAIASQFGVDYFVTAQLADLGLANGEFCWINAGHPAPLLFRGHKFVRELTAEISLPVGFGAGDKPTVNREQLEPGDRLLLYSDGVVEARISGELFGEQRLIEAVERELSSGLPHAETCRRLSLSLLRQRSGESTDDASLVLIQWLGPELDPPLAP